MKSMQAMVIAGVGILGVANAVEVKQDVTSPKIATSPFVFVGKEKTKTKRKKGNPFTHVKNSATQRCSRRGR
jgi:hypothetical protein